MTKRLFGTDGIRGQANTQPMTADLAMRVAMAAGLHFREDHNRRPLAVIGKDTRLSGYMIESAMVAGFTAIGMDVVQVGPMPTPAVAMLTPSLRADLGVVISASHNPFHDNGIKLFGPDGYKLSDQVEVEIERRLDDIKLEELATPRLLGRAQRLDDARGRYIEAVKASFPSELRLEGLKVVVDCANGAGYKVAPQVLFELGAEVVTIADQPNGFNINDKCGATDPLRMRAKVVDERADIGLALDGDADRLILSDEIGQVLDGDQVLGLIAKSWKEDGRLKGGGVVATIMSNLGLERFLEGQGLTLERTKVGDRYVLERMRAAGFNVGGEQSGHMIFSDYSRTGDGLMTALQVLAVLVRSGRRMSRLGRVFDPVPQILKSVRFRGGAPLENKDVKAAIAEGETALGKTGRLVIRPSGTEPVIRVMGEGEDQGQVTRVVDEICAVIERGAAEAAE